MADDDSGAGAVAEEETEESTQQASGEGADEGTEEAYIELICGSANPVRFLTRQSTGAVQKKAAESIRKASKSSRTPKRDAGKQEELDDKTMRYRTLNTRGGMQEGDMLAEQSHGWVGVLLRRRDDDHDDASHCTAAKSTARARLIIA